VYSRNVRASARMHSGLRAGPLHYVWKPAVNGRLAAEAIERSAAVGRRLRATERVETAAKELRRQTRFPQAVHWWPHSIAQGYAGLAVSWSYFDSCFPGEGWDAVAHEHLTLAVRGAENSAKLPLGIFSGMSGVAFAGSQLSRGGTRYGRLMDKLDGEIVPRASTLAEKLPTEQGMNVGTFDLIAGLSGVGAYLLCRTHQVAACDCLHSLTAALVQMALSGGEVPSWYTPCDRLGDEKTKDFYPNGNLNLGLAHGIPGPLAFLSLAHRAGVPEPGLPDAIAHLADWICSHRLDDPWGVNWPTAVPLVQNGSSNSPRLSVGESASAPGGPSRTAWCYGSPGIARALWLAGEALNKDEYRQVAASAMEAVFRRPIAVRQIDSPTFCHGVSGLLAIALRFANEMGGEMFSDEIASMVRQILDTYQPESLLGFKNIEVPGNEIDQPGLLDGAAGVALVLLAASTSVEPVWDRLFLLS
jgi:hypothetical protein